MQGTPAGVVEVGLIASKGIEPGIVEKAAEGEREAVGVVSGVGGLRCYAVGDHAGFDGEESALPPNCGDRLLDLGAFIRVAGLPFGKVPVTERVEILLGFVVEDDLFASKAVAQAV